MGITLQKWKNVYDSKTIGLFGISIIILKKFFYKNIKVRKMAS